MRLPETPSCEAMIPFTHSLPPSVFCIEREKRQHDEVLQPQQEISQARGDRRRDAKVYLPQSSGAGLPQPQTLLAGGDARELLARVAHVEHLVLEQAGEDGARFRVAAEH